MNKQNTEQLKKENKVKRDIVKVLDYYYTYKSRITDSIVVDLFNAVLPHLISSDEIKREAERLLQKYNDFLVKKRGKPQYMAETDVITGSNDLQDLLDEFLTQSKEGGE